MSPAVTSDTGAADSRLSALAVERGVWLAGLALAAVPSIIAPIEPLRVWLTIVLTLVAAVTAALIPVDAVRPLRVPSAIVLTTASVLMGARTLAQASFASADLAVTVAGVGALIVAATLIWTSGSRPGDASAGRVATGISAAGATLLVAMTIVVSDGEVARTTLTTAFAATAGVAGAALLALPRWRGLGAVLAVAGLVAAHVAISARLIVLQGADSASIEPDFWAVIALGITAAIGIMALRATASSSIDRTAAISVGVAVSIAVVFFTAAELVFLRSSPGSDLRALFTMSVLALIGVAGAIWRSRLGLAPPIVAAASAAVFALAAVTLYGVGPLELVTVAPALALLILGARALVRRPQRAHLARARSRTRAADRAVARCTTSATARCGASSRSASSVVDARRGRRRSSSCKHR